MTYVLIGIMKQFRKCYELKKQTDICYSVMCILIDDGVKEQV